MEDYYTTDDNIWQSVVAAYDPLHWFDYANNYTGLNIYPEVLADQCFPGGGDVNDMDQWKKVFNFVSTSTSVLSTNYSNAYSGVKRCNDALHYMFDFWTPNTDLGPLTAIVTSRRHWHYVRSTTTSYGTGGATSYTTTRTSQATSSARNIPPMRCMSS